VKASTKFKHIIKDIAERQGRARMDVMLVIDGERLKCDDTPGDLGIEDGDVIDLLWNQCGC
jgi:hypothetical protein